MGMLLQGARPEKLAEAVACSVVCSLFPSFVIPALLNLTVGLGRGLNQPLMHAINSALTPLHLLMILVYVRLGEALWQSTDSSFSLSAMVDAFQQLPLSEFLQQFSRAGFHAVTAWAVTAPGLFLITYYPARAALRRLAQLLPVKETPVG